MLNRRTLTRLGAPLRWSPGDAALSYSVFRPQLYLNGRDGLEEWDPSFSTQPIRHISSSAVPGSVTTSAAHDLIAYSAGDGVQVMARGGSGWELFESFSTAAQVSKLRLLSDETSLSVVYQAGTEVWLASRRGTLPWRHRRILDAGAPLVEIADFAATETSARVAFRTATAAWAARPGDGKDHDCDDFD